MKIIEIVKVLKDELYGNGYEYGFIVKGKVYKPNKVKGLDAEFYENAKNISVIQEPMFTMKSKIGTCVDTCVLMKSILDNRGISNKVWLLYNEIKNKVHTIVTFDSEEKVIYVELTPESSKSWYGQEIIYDNENDFISFFSNQNYEVTDVTEKIVIGDQL